MKMKQFKPGRVIMGRLPMGNDLLETVTRICQEERITCGRLEGIGSVQNAQVTYYDQKTQKYLSLSFKKRLEVLKLTGNISQKDGKVMVHAHILLSDDKGQVYGGHLCEGTKIFAFELVLQEFTGGLFKRAHDKETGLNLWT